MTTLSPSERSYIITGISNSTAPTRLDGRDLLTPRPISISYGDAPQANGSARIVVDGGTEVIAGIRLEVGDVDPSVKGKGKEGWRAKVDVDVTPQAYPNLSSTVISTLSTVYASIISDHFIPSLPPLPILPPTKYFIPHVHLTVLSSFSGSVPSTLILAVRAAFTDLRIPRTRKITWQGSGAGGTVIEGEEIDLSGIKAAVRGKHGGKGRSGGVGQGGDDWDLDMQGDGVDFLPGREELPVMVTLNLVPNSPAVFLDATPSEESACPDHVHLFYNQSGRLVGMRTEGNQGLDISRIRPLLLEGKRIASELITSLNAQIPT